MILMSCPHCQRYLTFGACIYHGDIKTGEQVRNETSLKGQAASGDAMDYYWPA